MAPSDKDVRGVVAALARGALGEAYVPEVPDRVLEAIGHVPEFQRGRLLAALKAMDGRLGALALTGRPVPVSWLSPKEAGSLLQRWRDSRLAAQRQLFLLMVSKTLAAVYGHPGPGWERVGYQGPMGEPPEMEPELHPVTVDRDEIINCDVVIVGSGPGGGCSAAVLAAAGLDVVVVEKGGYYSERDFSHLEGDAAKMYLYQMNLATVDLGVQILAGSVVGGGSLVNYSTSFKTPPHVLKEWHEVSGVEAFVSGEIEEHLEIVAQRNNVNTDSSAAGKRDELMEEGLKRLGWHVDALPRGVKGCTQDERCGFCGFGCRPGAKQSSMKTWLVDAERAGARIIADTDIRRVRIDGSRATGVEGRCNGHRVVINASKAVIVAAGAIESPALLLRSGLKGQVGRNLKLHPSTAAWGLFDDDVRIWEGTLQSRYSSEFRHWDGGYGPIFETVPVHPGNGAAAVPWLSAADHARRMSEFSKISFVASLLRDETPGRIRINKDGSIPTDNPFYNQTTGKNRAIWARGLRNPF
ncbi:MAG: GMC family oxidoreductase N-terminal domain-containing protein, partial [Actinomycetota bacterium]